MIGQSLKSRLSEWKVKADHVFEDHWIRFIIYWMIFDACITEYSGKDSDRGKLDWFYSNNNELKDVFLKFWRLPEYLSLLEELKTLSPISDMRPTRRGLTSISLNDINNEKEIFEFIYQIRCNTFHGAKDLYNKRDNDLTRFSEMLFNKPLDLFLGLK